MRHLSISVLFRVALVGFLTWLIVVILASIAPIWAIVGVRATTIIVPALVAAGFVALFVALLSLLAASTWAGGAPALRRRWRPTT